MVTEAGTADIDHAGVPLANVEVTLGSQSVMTLRNGAFQFTNVPSGRASVRFDLDGYEGKTVDVQVSGNTAVDVELEPSGGEIIASGDTGDRLDDLDGTETDDTVITIEGNVNDLVVDDDGTMEPMSYIEPMSIIAPMTTAIDVATLQALINGTIHTITPESNGNFRQAVPVDPGINTIQLRVFDTDDNAYTTRIVRVTVTVDRLDMRVTLHWNKDNSDVDIHMFQREVDEDNPMGNRSSQIPWNAADNNRHVGYYNKTPSDFGSGPQQNPVLDIDDTSGYGPETIVLQEATPGYYHVWVHLYAIRSAGPIDATVEVVLNEPGRETPRIERFEKTLTENKEYWYVTTVAWPVGEFITVDPSGDYEGGLFEPAGSFDPYKK